jgi:hypothetical protein
MLLNALEGVHRLGWLHRDVKPANFALYQVRTRLGARAWQLPALAYWCTAFSP